jgi:septal ring factor EnvC (AmiA/AmiB activator)
MTLQRFFIIFFIICFPLSLLLWGQNSRSTLETKRKDLNKQIENTSKLLSKTTKSRQHTVQELSTLQRQVESRSELVKLIRQELDSIEIQLESKQCTVKEITEELEKMKKAYKKVLVQLYRHKSNNSTVYFLLSSESFNKAYQKQLYLSQLEKRRSEQAVVIRKTQAVAASEITVLEKQRAEKSALLGEELDQKGSLSKELAEKDQIMRSLKSKEAQLRKELNAKEKSKKQLNNKIENIIREQIAVAKNETRQYNTNSTVSPKTNGTYIPSSPGTKEDENSFINKKGKLSAPVSGGVIVSKFGRQQHPLFEQVFTHNNGIDLRTGADAAVRAVHAGTVVSVFAVPGNGNAVMLKHGNFYTTYSNLSVINVKRGDAVNTGTGLGTVGKDITTGNYLLHFELWNGKNKENPEHWLR